MDNLPPPIEMNPGEPASYFRGYLYYYDPNPENTMHWVLYNGQDKMRFISRTALENYVIELQERTPDRVVQLLMRAYARTQRAWQDIDRAAGMSDGRIRPDLEGLTVQLRRLSDLIDRYVSQLIV